MAKDPNKAWRLSACHARKDLEDLMEVLLDRQENNQAKADK